MNGSLFASLRQRDENLAHLLDVAVQVLRDHDLLAEYEEVLYEDWEAMRAEADA